MFEHSQVKQWDLKQSRQQKTINKGQRQYRITQRTMVIHDQQPSFTHSQKDLVQQIIQMHHHQVYVQDPNYRKLNVYNKPKQPWWNMFSCCKQVEIQKQYQDCGVCNKRFYTTKPLQRQQQPYVSTHRMRARQKQPINVFYDRIANNQLIKSRWDA